MGGGGDERGTANVALAGVRLKHALDWLAIDIIRSRSVVCFFFFSFRARGSLGGCRRVLGRVVAVFSGGGWVGLGAGGGLR